jgi:hypothetical protein
VGPPVLQLLSVGVSGYLCRNPTGSNECIRIHVPYISQNVSGAEWPSSSYTGATESEPAVKLRPPTSLKCSIPVKRLHICRFINFLTSLTLEPVEQCCPISCLRNDCDPPLSCAVYKNSKRFVLLLYGCFVQSPQ